MKRLMLAAALAASSSACVANQGDASIRFLQAGPLSGDASGCKVTTGGAQLPQGQLDVSGGGTYLVGLVVEANIAQRDVTVGGKVLSGPGLNDITLNEVVLTYESKVTGLPKEERIPIYGVFRPGSGSGSYAILPAFGPEALKVLAGSLKLPSQDPATKLWQYDQVTVLSTIKATGKLSSGLAVETNEVQFPVIVSNSGYAPGTKTCPSGLTVSASATGACGQVGQDVGPICR